MKTRNVFAPYLTSFLGVMIISLFIITGTTLAATSYNVSGKIKTSSNANADGASVSVTCNSTTIPTTSASNGNFSVTFDSADCASGDTISVFASFNGEEANVSDTAGPETTNFGNIILGAPVAVPEYGIMTGTLAAVGAAGAFLMMKKRLLFTK